MAQVCICCGLRPEDFWNATPWETNALAQAYIENRKASHKRQAWFTAHIMTATGNFKRGSGKRILQQLNSPVEKAPDMREITSFEQLKAWETEHAKFIEAKDDPDGRNNDDDRKV